MKDNTRLDCPIGFGDCPDCANFIGGECEFITHEKVCSYCDKPTSDKAVCCSNQKALRKIDDIVNRQNEKIEDDKDDRNIR